MTRRELIAKCSSHIGAAHGCAETNQHEHYAQHMQQLLDLLIEELVGSPPGAPDGPYKAFNPEQVLEEIAIAIKHRTISDTHRWKIIYYHDRLTCVPTYISTPEQIILHEFTEKMVQKGFSLTYWNHLKANVVKLYKELNS
ncbi:unnamed protein product [marine sediment metagenome]|uniref:Uncharacterized protein n=1 Tax=marine sediment metagenome TaxID=412755 RepID=X1JNN2_9ZZZZ